MPLFRGSKKRSQFDDDSLINLVKDKNGSYALPLSRLDILDWINNLMLEKGACKVGRMGGYKDQWLIGACYEEAWHRIQLCFCQGRHIGRIKSDGGYGLNFNVIDCETHEDIWFKFNDLRHTRKETQDIIRGISKDLISALTNNDHALIHECMKKFYWLGYDMDLLKGFKMTEQNEIEMLQQKVDIALKNGATPSLKVCEQLREVSPEQAKWLDDTYLKYKRPELVGDDKDGLCALLKSEGYLRKAIEKCKPEEVVYWFRIVKGLDPLPDSVREDEVSPAEETA